MPSYPETARGDVVETLHDREIADPYRWLEDPDAAETVDWVRRQNEFSEAQLAELPGRAWFTETMRAVLARPRAGTPRKRSGRFLVSRNDGRQNQDVTYVADSLAELLAGGRVLVEPNTFSADGTSSLASLDLTGDGRLAAYSVSEGGSDWQTFSLLDVTTGEPVADVPMQTKFSAAAWLPDGRSYVYTYFEHEGHAVGTETTKLARPQLRIHRLGRSQADDEIVLEFPEDDQLMFWAETTDDDAYLVVSIVAGTENRNRLWAFPIEPGALSGLGEAIKVVDEPNAEYVVAGSDGPTLYLRTDLAAQRGRLVAVDLSGAEPFEPREVIAEAAETLEEVIAAGDGFVAVYLDDAQPSVRRFDVNGRPVDTLPVTGGALIGLEGKRGDADLFVGLSSTTTPTQSWHVDLGTGSVTALPTLVQGAGDTFAPPEIAVRRAAGTSRDGTSVPYFVITRADDDGSAPAPTLLWGYGGFKIGVFADYRPGWAGWLAAGGRLAIANLRGGGEFGTDWYEAGRLSRKQNVFDDCVAVAEHLISSGVSSSDQLAIYGRSNGGLLVGAVLTQRPDLFAAAIPGVGVLDMLRFHLFTVGSAWISDYGDPDDPEQFADALAYSPLHNVSEQDYPATLVLTSDHDDRVVPLHSHKFTATLQRAQTADRPILTRIETATGHGMGKPTALVAAEWADLLAFAAHHTGLTVPETSPVGAAGAEANGSGAAAERSGEAEGGTFET